MSIKYLHDEKQNKNIYVYKMILHLSYFYFNCMSRVTPMTMALQAPERYICVFLIKAKYAHLKD